MKPDKVYLSLTLMIIFITISWITSCTHQANIADIPEICFGRDVLPVFTNSCAIPGCHNAGGGSESHLALNDYTNISLSVVPFNPNSSQIYKAITATWGENKMPPDQPLSLGNRTIIRLWIEQGAKSTVCPDTTGTGGGNNYVNPRACFTRDILPVLVSRCAITGCHNSVSHKEGYNYTGYTSTMTSVSPGNPGNSRLYQAILGTEEDKMPPSNRSQLSVAEIDSIAKWISYGALNENCGEVCDTLNPVTFSGTLWSIIQTSCTGCHSGASPGGGVALTNYADVNAIALNGSLMNSLRGTGVSKMPQGGSFSTCRIRQFEIWVNNGSLNNQ